MKTCCECGNAFRLEDVAPLRQINAWPRVEGYLFACRKCITTYIKQGFLQAINPFWRRQQGCEV